MINICIIATIVIYLVDMLLVGFVYSKSNEDKAPVSGLTEEDQPLFQKLRELRTEIARREKIPPYMVFSDKTLIHMCILKPVDKERMLQVTGVGEHKYEKYGKEFEIRIKELI